MIGADPGRSRGARYRIKERRRDRKNGEGNKERNHVRLDGGHGADGRPRKTTLNKGNRLGRRFLMTTSVRIADNDGPRGHSRKTHHKGNHREYGGDLSDHLV